MIINIKLCGPISSPNKGIINNFMYLYINKIGDTGKKKRKEDAHHTLFGYIQTHTWMWLFILEFELETKQKYSNAHSSTSIEK